MPHFPPPGSSREVAEGASKTNIFLWYIWKHVWICMHRLGMALSKETRSLRRSSGKSSSYFQNEDTLGGSRRPDREAAPLAKLEAHILSLLCRGMALARDYSAKHKPWQKPHCQWASSSFPLVMSTCKEWKHRTKKEPPEILGGSLRLFNFFLKRILWLITCEHGALKIIISMLN